MKPAPHKPEPFVKKETLDAAAMLLLVLYYVARWANWSRLREASSR